MPNYDERADPSEWSSKLLGKKILGDDVEAPASLSSDQIVRRSQLPTPHRVLPPGAIVTMDMNPKRLNVHVDKANIVTSVSYG